MNESLDDPRQYYCPECETLTIIKDGQRICKCEEEIEDNSKWVEVFYDRTEE